MKLAEGEFLAGIGRQGKPEDGHAGNQDARHDQVEEVVECASSDDDDEGDVYVRFWAAIVVDFVSLTGHPCDDTKRRLVALILCYRVKIVFNRATQTILIFVAIIFASLLL